jgi:hypothetical protein
VLTVSKTLAELTEEALGSLYRLAERPHVVVMGAADLTSSGADVTMQLATVGDEGTANEGDVLEFDRELVLVRAKDSSSPVNYTVVRAYNGTTLAAHAPGVVGLVNPPHPRARVQQSIVRSLSKMDVWTPHVVTASFNRVAGYDIINLPTNTMHVYRVGFFGTTGRFYELGGWSFFDDMVTTSVQSVGGDAVSFTPTAQLLRLPLGVIDTDDLVVTYQLPWAFSSATPAEIDSVTLPRGADNLPASYTAAYLAARREIGRLELDNADEFNKMVPATGGSNVSIIRDLWQQFYRELDEARRLYRPPTYRPWRMRPRGF